MVYTAFLKGINVGGKNIIKMDALNRLFMDLGYTDVKTYIQSGNVVFSCGREKSEVAKDIEDGIKARYDISSNVVVKSAEEVKKAVEANPFKETDGPYLGMTNDGFSDKDREAIDKLKEPANRIKVIGSDIYFLPGGRFGASKLAKGLAKLDSPVTVRNWKTVNKVYQMVMIHK